MDNDKFSFNILKDVKVQNKGNEKLSMGEALKKQAEDIICFDEIEVGDLVLTRGDNRLILIKEAPFKIEGLGYFEFAGKDILEESEDLVMLNRHDIERVVQKKDNEIIKL